MTDAGLFGPDSVAWRLHADPSMFVAAMRALLVQALEPRAMAGVVQHSDYKADPWGRLNRTVEFVLAHDLRRHARPPRRRAAAVRRIHDRVHGVDPVTGRAYSAHDPDLLLWIHAVEVHSVVFAYRRYAGRLADADADRYVDEMARVAELLGLPSDDGAALDGGAARLPPRRRRPPDSRRAPARACARSWRRRCRSRCVRCGCSR